MAATRRKASGRSKGSASKTGTGAGSARGRSSTTAPQSSGERKEKVLHTRVSDSLERQIKHKARNLGLSASTVVRHILLNTFGLVEDIVADSTNLALSIAGDQAKPSGDARGTRRRGSQARGGEVLGWHEAILNLNGVCEHCNAVLRKGTRAAVGVRDAPGPWVFLCRPCLEKLEPE